MTLNEQIARAIVTAHTTQFQRDSLVCLAIIERDIVRALNAKDEYIIRQGILPPKS
jgi:hypothetical protein